jgi:hypothetical protein
VHEKVIPRLVTFIVVVVHRTCMRELHGELGLILILAIKVSLRSLEVAAVGILAVVKCGRRIEVMLIDWDERPVM